jgi:hypothetical protein
MHVEGKFTWLCDGNMQIFKLHVIVMIYSEEVLLMWKLNVKHANIIKNRIITRTTIGWKLIFFEREQCKKIKNPVRQNNTKWNKKLIMNSNIPVYEIVYHKLAHKK